MLRYKEIPIDDWSGICNIERRDNKDTWIFRGHKPGTSLESSLERAILYYPEELNNKPKIEIEDFILREFRRRYHQYSSDIPEKDDDLEWFSLMQHFGAPTRLLDFTYSIYIAAYFALEYAETNSNNIIKPFEIFAINADWACKQSANKFSINDYEHEFLSKKITDNQQARAAFNITFRRNLSKRFVCPFNPFRLTERITIQKGVFMCPGNVDATFEENIAELSGWEDKVVKYKLNFDREKLVKARECLYDLNITRGTLFPGIDGFAKSLSIYPPKTLIKDPEYNDPRDI